MSHMQKIVVVGRREELMIGSSIMTIGSSELKFDKLVVLIGMEDVVHILLCL